MNNSAQIWLAQTEAPSTPPPAPTPSGPSGQPTAPFFLHPMFFLMILMVGMFWWMNRQQKKQREARQKLLDSVKSGDKIITTGGIHGIVANTKEKTLIVKIADNVKIEINRSAVEAVEPRTGGEESVK